MNETRSLRRRAALFPSMLRLLPLAICVSGCGGFVTPPQNVAIGLALTGASGLPPRIEREGKVMVLTRLRLTGAALIEGRVLAGPATTELPLTSAWTGLVEGPLARGEYKDVKLELSELALDGTLDGSPFHLEQKKLRTRELKLPAPWRIELGTMSALSLRADPRAWMTHDEGSTLELIDPASEQASEQLMDRFFESLTAARDDDHDGVEDPAAP